MTLPREVSAFLAHQFAYLDPGVRALGLSGSYAEKVFGFVLSSGHIPNLPTEDWIFYAMLSLNTIGLSGASPNVLKGISAKQLGTLYGLSEAHIEGLRVLLQKTREHSGPRDRALYFLDCTMRRTAFRLRAKARNVPKQAAFLSLYISLFWAMVLGVIGITEFAFSLGWPAIQTTLLLLAMLALFVLGIRPAIRIGIQSTFGIRFFEWYHKTR